MTVFLLFKAYQIGQASRVGPVYGFSLVLSVLGGILLLGEREHVRLKVAGMAVAAAGVLMLRLA